MVVPLLGASDNPSAVPWKHSVSGVDSTEHMVCREFKNNKKWTRIWATFYYYHMLAILNNVQGKAQNLLYWLLTIAVVNIKWGSHLLICCGADIFTIFNCFWEKKHICVEKGPFLEGKLSCFQAQQANLYSLLLKCRLRHPLQKFISHIREFLYSQFTQWNRVVNCEV